VARDKSSVVARDNSRVEAWENVNVEARGNCSVEARGNVIIRLFSALKITATAYVTIIKHGTAATLEGGRQLDAEPFPKDASAVTTTEPAIAGR
jgi:hypothetical protein